MNKFIFRFSGYFTKGHRKMVPVGTTKKPETCASLVVCEWETTAGYLVIPWLLVLVSWLGPRHPAWKHFQVIGSVPHWPSHTYIPRRWTVHLICAGKFSGSNHFSTRTSLARFSGISLRQIRTQVTDHRLIPSSNAHMMWMAAAPVSLDLLKIRESPEKWHSKIVRKRLVWACMDVGLVNGNSNPNAKSKY